MPVVALGLAFEISRNSAMQSQPLPQDSVVNEGDVLPLAYE